MNIESPKAVLLRIIGEDGPIEDSAVLTIKLNQRGYNFHRDEVVHKTWDLQKQSLVQFLERSTNGHKDTTGIKLTERGRQILKGMTTPEIEVPTMAMTETKLTIADRIESTMLDAGPERVWRSPELVEELGLEGQFARQSVTNTLNRDSRFAVVDQPGHWTLTIWAKPAQPRPESGPIEIIKTEPSGEHVTEKERIAAAASNGVVRARDTVAVTATPQHQNEKPAPTLPAQNGADLLAGLSLVVALFEKAEKGAKLAEAAAMLEAAGEVELALQTMSKIELTPLETQVVELVRRVRGQAADA